MSKMTAVKPKVLISFFEKRDFYISRYNGDHVIMQKEGLQRPLVIPVNKDVSVRNIQTNLKTADISREEYMAEIYPSKKKTSVLPAQPLQKVEDHK